MKRQLSNVENWRPKVAGKPQIAMWMGASMAAGLEHYGKHFDGGFGPPGLLTPQEIAVDYFHAEMEHFRQAGGSIEDSNLDEYDTLLPRGVTYYTENNPVKHKIVGVEYPFPEFGYSRCDLIVDDGEGYAPIDHKWKKALYVKPGETKDQARYRTLVEYEDSWQLLQYVWCIRQHFKVRCDHYYIVLGELNPRPHVTIQRFDVTEALLAQFAQSSLQYWSDMNEVDAGKRVVTMAATHASKYGPCEFSDACLKMGLDRERMKFKYLQLARREAK